MTKELKVEIVELEPMTVASVRAISMSPEEDTLKKLVAFAKPRGFLDNLKKHPIFGFNNPNPSKQGKEYGYEFWMKVDPKTEVAGEVELKKFDGGLYAVTKCNLTQEAQSDFLREHGQLESWYRLVEWLKSSQYKMADHQCLEKALNPEQLREIGTSTSISQSRSSILGCGMQKRLQAYEYSCASGLHIFFYMQCSSVFLSACLVAPAE
jgi:DNA gyrase inhibitor GyrI